LQWQLLVEGLTSLAERIPMSNAKRFLRSLTFAAGMLGAWRALGRPAAEPQVPANGNARADAAQPEQTPDAATPEPSASAEPAPSTEAAPGTKTPPPGRPRWTGERWVYGEPAAPAEAPAAEPAPEPAETPTEPRKRHRQTKPQYPDLALLGGVLSPFLGEYLFDLDVAVSHTVSLNVVLDFLNQDAVSGIAFGFGPQLFLTGDDPLTGLYLWPRFAYGRVTAGGSTDALIFAATLGYEWLWQPVALRLGAGAIYTSLSSPATCKCTSLDGPRILLDLAFGFGGPVGSE
jgi:hypothetical protein